MSFELHHGDCLDVMATLPDASIDCVLTDPPYGTTACKWDSVIPFEPMWKELTRIAKPKAAICLFGSQPFTSALVMSNPKMFRYEWIWHKNTGGNFAVSKFQPIRYHEQVVVFGKDTPDFCPLPTQRFSNASEKACERPIRGGGKDTSSHASLNIVWRQYDSKTKSPESVLRFKSVPNANGKLHPTQKPVELLRYLIRTYTQTGQTVLDFTMGSGSTGVACEMENRKFIGIEKDANYFEIAKNRIEGVRKKEPLFAEAA